MPPVITLDQAIQVIGEVCNAHVPPPGTTAQVAAAQYEAIQTSFSVLVSHATATLAEPDAPPAVEEPGAEPPATDPEPAPKPAAKAPAKKTAKKAPAKKVAAKPS